MLLSQVRIFSHFFPPQKKSIDIAVIYALPGYSTSSAEFIESKSTKDREIAYFFFGQSLSTST